MTSITSLPPDIVPPAVARTLQKLESVESILTRPSVELGYLLQVPVNEVETLRSRLARHLATQPSISHPALPFGSVQCASALDMVARTNRPIPLGGVLDQALNGGLVRGSVVDLSGCAGCGKTQLALQALCHALLIQPPGYVVWIATHASLPITRLLSIWTAVAPTLALPMNRILTKRIDCADELVHTVTYLLPAYLASGHCVPLLVVDCVAELFRLTTAHSYASKVSGMIELTTALHRIGALFLTTSLLINQATPDLLFDEKSALVRSVHFPHLDQPNPEFQPTKTKHLLVFNPATDSYTRKITTLNLTPISPSSLTRHVPALGLEWARLIHHRILLSKTGKKHELRVLAGFQVPQGTSIHFNIHEGGVRGFV